MPTTPVPPVDPAAQAEPRVSDTTTAPAAAEGRAPQPREIGGREGLEPTRYGDWEKAGRCIDF
jgi:hypothetical protein